MIISATISLAQGDVPTMSAEDTAAAILEAAGGDPEKDACTVQMLMPVAGAGAPSMLQSVPGLPMPAPVPAAPPEVQAAELPAEPSAEPDSGS